MPASQSLGYQPFRASRHQWAARKAAIVHSIVAPALTRTRPIVRKQPRQRYLFLQTALLYCRTCERLRPHLALKDRSGVECRDCGRAMLAVEVVATYSADELDNPAPIMLPLRLIPPALRIERIVTTEEDE